MSTDQRYEEALTIIEEQAKEVVALKSQLTARDAEIARLKEAERFAYNGLHATRDELSALRGRLGELVKEWREQECVASNPEHPDCGEAAAVLNCIDDLESALAEKPEAKSDSEQSAERTERSTSNIEAQDSESRPDVPTNPPPRTFTPAEMREAMIRAFTIRAEVTVEQARTFIDDYLASREGGKK